MPASCARLSVEGRGPEALFSPQHARPYLPVLIQKRRVSRSSVARACDRWMGAGKAVAVRFIFKLSASTMRFCQVYDPPGDGTFQQAVIRPSASNADCLHAHEHVIYMCL